MKKFEITVTQAAKNFGVSNRVMYLAASNGLFKGFAIAHKRTSGMIFFSQEQIDSIKKYMDAKNCTKNHNEITLFYREHGLESTAKKFHMKKKDIRKIAIQNGGLNSKQTALNIKKLAYQNDFSIATLSKRRAACLTFIVNATDNEAASIIAEVGMSMDDMYDIEQSIANSTDAEINKMVVKITKIKNSK